jgi:hypothetical protein
MNRYFIYPAYRIEQGQKPFQRYGNSARDLAKSWKKRYGDYPTRIEQAVWNPDQHEFVPDPNGDTWVKLR